MERIESSANLPARLSRSASVMGTSLVQSTKHSVQGWNSARGEGHHAAAHHRSRSAANNMMVVLSWPGFCF